MLKRLSGRPLIAGTVVFALALGVRLVFAAKSLPGLNTGGDAGEYVAYARSLASGGVFSGPMGMRAGRMPGYPAFLAGVYSLCGPSNGAVLLAQGLLGALVCAMMFLLAGRFMEPPWPLLCGLSGAVYADLIAPAGSLLSEGLLAFCALCAVFALNWENRGPAARAALFGAGAGLAYLVRPEALAYFLAIGFLLPRISQRSRPVHAALALGVLLAFPAAWAGRNYVVLGELNPGSTSGSFSLYLGLRLPLCYNRCEEKDVFTPPPEASEVQRERLYAQALRSLRASLSPGRVLAAYLYNAATLFYPFLPGYDATFAFLAPFWLFALWDCRRRPEAWPLCLPVLVSLAVYSVAGGPASRYRQNYAPFAVMLAFLGLRSLYRRFPSRFSRWTGAWAALQFAVWAAAPGLRHWALALKASLWGGPS